MANGTYRLDISREILPTYRSYDWGLGTGVGIEVVYTVRARRRACLSTLSATRYGLQVKFVQPAGCEEVLPSLLRSPNSASNIFLARVPV